MRCFCCNVILTTQECCARFKNSNTYTEMCNRCIRDSDLQGDVVCKQREEVDEECVPLNAEEEEEFNYVEEE